MFNINMFRIWLFLFLCNSIICILRAHKTTPSDKLLAPVVNHGGSETKPGERAREPTFKMLTSSVSRRASAEAMKSFYACQRPWRTWEIDRERRWQDKFIRLHIWVIASLEKCNTSSFGLLPSRGGGVGGWRGCLAWFGPCAAQKVTMNRLSKTDKRCEDRPVLSSLYRKRRGWKGGGALKPNVKSFKSY